MTATVFKLLILFEMWKRKCGCMFHYYCKHEAVVKLNSTKQSLISIKKLFRYFETI